MSTTLAQGSVGSSLRNGLDTIIGFIPNLIGALLILLIGYFVAKLLQKVVAKGLQKVGIDQRLQASQAGTYLERMSPGATPSGGISRVVFWLIFLFVIVAAIGALGISAVTGFMNAVLAYLPNIIAAIAILVVAALVATAIGALAQRTMGDTPTGKIAGTVGPTLVMGIAVFMILTQLRIAPQIVLITYGALIGAIALGLALAFGLGGREVAAEMLRSGYRKAQEQQEQVRSDMRLARERGQRDLEQARARTEASPQYDDRPSAGEARPDDRGFAAPAAAPGAHAYPPPERPQPGQGIPAGDYPTQSYPAQGYPAPQYQGTQYQGTQYQGTQYPGQGREYQGGAAPQDYPGYGRPGYPEQQNLPEQGYSGSGQTYPNYPAAGGSPGAQTPAHGYPAQGREPGQVPEPGQFSEPGQSAPDPTQTYPAPSTTPDEEPGTIPRNRPRDEGR